MNQKKISNVLLLGITLGFSVNYLYNIIKRYKLMDLSQIIGTFATKQNGL